MIKTAIVALSVCTLFAPLAGSAQDASPKQVTRVESPFKAQKASSGSCIGAGFGTNRMGTVVGMGGNWGGPGDYWIDFSSGGNITTEQPSSTIGNDNAKLMYSVLSMGYMNGDNITLYCDGNNDFESVWVGQ
jgi:hypothetical protein